MERKGTKEHDENAPSESNSTREDFGETFLALNEGSPGHSQIVADKATGGNPTVPVDLFEKLKHSLPEKGLHASNRGQQIKERVTKRRQSHEVSPDSSESVDSYAEGSYSLSDSSPQQKGRTKHDSRSVRQTVSSGPQADDENLRFPGGSKSDKAEWAKLLREKNKSDKKVSALSQEVDDLRSESKDMRNLVSSWQEQVSDMSTRQIEDRKKFQNSTELIAKARVELTKTMNENAMLKGKLHEQHLSSDIRDRRISALNATIDRQAKKITFMTRDMQDTETVLRHYTNENRRLEEELSAISLTRDGTSIEQVLQQLEQARVGWMEERERALETKRLALDTENNHILERDRSQHRKDAEHLIEVVKATREREKELDRVQADIVKQLDDLYAANKELRARFKEEHVGNTKEMKRKDHTITVIEQEVSKLRRKLASSQLRDQDNQALLAEIENNNKGNEELRKTLKRNSLLEKKIRKLKKELKEQKNTPVGDWKEIVLPGYKNLHGVTFGAPSDELAGFLTILVEDQKAKRADSQTVLRKEVRKYLRSLKEPGDVMGRGRSKSKKDRPSDKLKPTKKKIDAKTKEGKSKKQKHATAVAALDPSDRRTAKSTKESKSLKQLTREIEREIEFLEESRLKRRKKSRPRYKRHTASDDDETPVRSKRDRLGKKLKRGTTGEIRKGSKRKDLIDSDDSSSARHWKNSNSKDRKHFRSSRERVERTERAKKKNGAGATPRYPTLEDNLQRVAEMEEGSSSISARIPEPDDISLVVMKHTHLRKPKKGKSKKKRKGRAKRGSGTHGLTSDAAPQLILALQ